MSNVLLRRNSNKQSLQNLMRLTAQRSIEDAEEVERERRRRAREASLRMKSGSAPGESSPENEMSAEENAYDGVLKPSSSPSLEEDEGFSDWTQRQERRRQQHLQELSQDRVWTEEDTTGTEHTVQTSGSSWLQRRREEESDQMETERRKRREEEAMDRVRRENQRTEEEQRRREEQMTAMRRRPAEVDQREDVKVSYTSKVFLQQEPKFVINTNEEASGHMTSYQNNNKTKRSKRAVQQEEAEPILQPAQRPEKIQQEKEIQEQLRHRQEEQELEELKRRREERRHVREEEEQRRRGEEEQRRRGEEERHRLTKEDEETRRMEAAERMKSLRTSGEDGDENLSPKAPNHKISERTESLSRSLKKSNSLKKSQPLGLLPKIDKLEQYAHAVETSHEARIAKVALIDLPSSPEVVASKKNLFEAGEALSQSSARAASCKEAEGLKVGVSSRITQWVKSTSEGGGGRHSTCRSADVKPGDVMQKKNMWEIISDSSGRAGQRAKGSAGSKRYKFVVTGHGKYEKVCVDKDGDEFTHGKSEFSDC
ncbi:non-muscle caldesmon [Thalassophryne amazonica]|uniref:non-muscle caldesmon n=1 Tax=Thalassophryne amazonica TaxID=390379 RepID=UPI001470C0C4|nr:non-muscle caldesmon [Thalassophryne amazonica]